MTKISLQESKDNMSKDIFGITIVEAFDKGICINCLEKAIPKCYSDAGKREYNISGLCEECFDNIIGVY